MMASCDSSQYHGRVGMQAVIATVDQTEIRGLGTARRHCRHGAASL